MSYFLRFAEVLEPKTNWEQIQAIHAQIVAQLSTTIRPGDLWIGPEPRMSYFSRFAQILDELGPFDSLVLWVAMDIPYFGID